MTRSFHYQNLTDGKRATWRHGRAWWGRWHAEWSVLMNPSLGVSFEKGGHVEDGTGVQFHLALLLFSVYVSFDAAELFGRPYRELKERRLSAAWHAGDVQFHLWTGDEDWHRDRPWHRNCVSLHVKEWITGRPQFSSTEGSPVDVLIPMPEGCYAATARPVSRVWRYRFGRTVTRDSWDVDVPGGIPFEGKGENSWDCGEDGLFGTGGSGSLETVVGQVVGTVLEYRRKRGDVARLRDTPPVMAR